MAIFKYWLPEHAQSLDDAFQVDSECRHPQDVAADAARNYHQRRGGYEAEWPLRITVEMQNVTQRTFEVDRESRPHFFAVEI